MAPRAAAAAIVRRGSVLSGAGRRNSGPRGHDDRCDLGGREGPGAFGNSRFGASGSSRAVGRCRVGRDRGRICVTGGCIERGRSLHGQDRAGSGDSSCGGDRVGVLGRLEPALLGDEGRPQRHREFRVRVDRDRPAGRLADHLGHERDPRRTADEQEAVESCEAEARALDRPGRSASMVSLIRGRSSSSKSSRVRGTSVWSRAGRPGSSSRSRIDRASLARLHSSRSRARAAAVAGSFESTVMTGRGGRGPTTLVKSASSKSIPPRRSIASDRPSWLEACLGLAQDRGVERPAAEGVDGDERVPVVTRSRAGHHGSAVSLGLGHEGDVLEASLADSLLEELDLACAP